MHDHFWSLAGRQDWWNPEPKQMVFLGEFFLQLGELRHGDTWEGRAGMPSRETAEPLQKEIAQLAAGGAIRTFVLNPKTFEFHPIARAAWRNVEAIRSRFSRCQIDACDGVRSIASGRHHGYIFVDKGDVESVFAGINPSAIVGTDGRLVSETCFSDYLRFMVHFAITKQWNLENLPLAKQTEDVVEKAWRQWCESDERAQERHAGRLSANRRRALNVLLRGEPEREVRALNSER